MLGYLSLPRMHLFLISSLLGAAAFVVQVTTTENTESVKVSVSVWPPGPTLYIGESVLLLCSVQSNSSSVQTYRWFRDTPLAALASDPRHSVSGDSCSITGVTREDEGKYWCQTEWREGNSSMELQSQPVFLTVSNIPGSTLTVSPNSRYIFNEENFTLHCPKSTSNPSNWRLKHLSQDRAVTSSDFQADHCSPLGGAVTSDRPNGCTLTAVSENSGLYWCESAAGRTYALSITVSNASMIMKTPASPVPEGHKAVLYCQYRTHIPGHTSFYKNRVKIYTYTSHSNTSIMMTLDNVTQNNEGFYKCKSEDQSMESAESWLSVQTNQGNSSIADGTADVNNGYGRWIIISCVIILLFLIPVSVWLMWRSRYKTICAQSCGPLHTPDVPAVDAPATTQDMTEVQWDLSWMEMSNLLDKSLYPGT